MIRGRASIVPLVKRAELLYTEKTGQKCQASFVPFREDVLSLPDRGDITDQQIMDYCHKVEQEVGWKVVGVYYHKDEGYVGSKYIEGDEDFHTNYHIHVLYYCQDPETGKAIRPQREYFSLRQDWLSKATGMERGNYARDTGRRRRRTQDQRIIEQEKRIEKLEQISKEKEEKYRKAIEEKKDLEKERDKLQREVKNLKVVEAVKEKTLGVFGQSKKDEAIKTLRNQIERMEKHARGEEGRKLSALAGAVIPLEEEIKRLKDENAYVYKLAQINVVEKVKHAAGLYVNGSNGHETPEDIGKAWKRKFNEVKNLQQQNDKLLEEKKSLIDSFLNLPIIKKLIEIIQKALNDYDYEFCGEDRTYISNMIKGDSYQEEKSIAEKLFDSIIDLLKMAGEHIRQTWLDVTRRSFVEIADDRWGGEEIEQSRSLRL